ncbi:nucleotide sugar dehydrogenase [uncultured Sunxiuqinia sp.]|uniref:nucleotide sugar dehydrogenase n=1 Tax=uncultured Sunxiuqinia sp. TaxID=1573825 RepID=UPI002AA7C8FD|nr:nucleotide sugar dehydrogenase [uncultured Sunxiuqinia sp.]
MKISIFGLGYVGCVGLGCLAEKGHQVIGVDVVKNKIDLVNNGKPTIIEKDVDDLIYDNWRKGRIYATENYVKAVEATEVSFICVGTPSGVNGHLDMSYVDRTAENIGKALAQKSGFHVVVIRSTVLPGTNKNIGEIIEKESGRILNQDFAIISNPEFLREGTAVKDYYNPAVTVIGSECDIATAKMLELYENVTAPTIVTSINVAELIKYVNNSFHALKITFANEVGNICKKLGIDSHEVMELFCKDDQLNISPYYFKPGFAYGGSCLPKDLRGLKTMAHDNYISSPVIEAIEVSNSQQKEIAYSIIESTRKKHIGIIGLSFKKGTDDLRYSPSVELCEKLLGKGYQLAIYDPNVNMTKLSGTNKDYVDLHIPHLSELITNDFTYVVDNSEVLVVSQNYKGIFSDIREDPQKIIVDLVKIKALRNHPNYHGICW